jgi:ribosomal-protein-alanine N-acetyltransferase
LIATKRLELQPANIELIQAALDGSVALSAALNVTVPSTWPPELLDRQALLYTLNRLTEQPHHAEWMMYFVMLRSQKEGKVLVGCVGHKGPPSEDGTVEVGYGIVLDHRCKGYATEATNALIDRIFATPRVRRVIAETLPELIASQGVLRKCGFAFIGEGSEPGVIRFELPRARYEERAAGK